MNIKQFLALWRAAASDTVGAEVARAELVAQTPLQTRIQLLDGAGTEIRTLQAVETRTSEQNRDANDLMDIHESLARANEADLTIQNRMAAIQDRGTPGVNPAVSSTRIGGGGHNPAIHNPEARNHRGNSATLEHLGLDRADGLALVRDLDAWGISDQGIQRLASREYTDDFMAWVRSCSSNPYGDSAAMRALTGTTIDGGGATVPLEMIGEIIQRRRAMNRVSSQVRRFQTSSDRVSIPKHSGDELSVQWVGAQGSVSEDTSLQDFNSVGIDVHRGGCLVVADRAWLEDSAFDMEGWIAEQIAYMYAKMLDDIIINGSGVGRPFGLAARTGTTTPADNLITCVNIGDDPTFTGLLTLLGTLPEGYLDNASWIWKRLTLFSKIFTLRDTNGQPLFGTNTTLAGGATGRVDAQLLGYPVIQSERMATSGAGAKDTYFGDLRAAYALVERVALSIEPYVDPAIQKKDQRGWYVRFRIGGDVLDETAVLCGLET